MTKERLKQKIHTIIFESETPPGKFFDLALILTIALSVVVVILESEPSFQASFRSSLYLIEWVFTLIFMLEYALRIYSVDRPLKYIFSFFGLIDLLSCLPTILSIFIPGAQSLLVIRALRLLRIFRILKLGWYFDEGLVILNALKAARAKILVFFFSVVLIIIVAGTTMYLIEGSEAGFTSIATSMYWAVVTLTTVGYGDIAPASTFGRFMASLLMIMGYAIIAVPTGIITSELTRSNLKPLHNEACPGCGAQGHEANAIYCHRCASPLSAKSKIK